MPRYLDGKISFTVTEPNARAPCRGSTRFLALQCMRSAYRRPCGASIRQGDRAGTRRANANWKREVKVPESPRLRRFAPTSSARSFVRSFASALHTRRRRRHRRRRVTIDVVTPPTPEEWRKVLVRGMSQDDDPGRWASGKSRCMSDVCQNAGTGIAYVSMCVIIFMYVHATLNVNARSRPLFIQKPECWEERTISK